MSISVHNANLSLALYIGKDQELAAQVQQAVASKYSLDILDQVPLSWPSGAEAVLLEYDGDSVAVLESIQELLTLSGGVSINVLLKQKDIDFVIQASHYGVQGFIDCPAEIPQILTIMHMQSRRKSGQAGMVTSFFSLKGGVGVTSIATNIASHIQDITKQKTVILDLNVPLGDTTLYLNMEDQSLYTVVDYILNIERFDEALVYNSLDSHESGLYVLALPTDLTELDNLSGAAIKKMIESLSMFFNHVIIDCASNLSEINLSCLDMSDNIVVVSEPSLSSLRAANKALDVCQRLGYESDTLTLLVNRSQQNIDQGIKEVIDYLNFNAVRYVNNDYFLFNDSMNRGQLIKDTKPESLVNKQICAIAHQLQFGVAMEVQQEDSAKENVTKWQIFLNNLNNLKAKFTKKVAK